MDILTPPRISSLEPRIINIITHSSADDVTESVIEGIYPFETVYSIKQRILLQHASNLKQWMPSHLFVAQSLGGGLYRPVEFSWPFTKSFEDPLAAGVAGIANKQIYGEDGRKAIFPKVYNGITLETGTTSSAAGAGAVGSKQRTELHIWNLESVLRAANITPGTVPSDAVFEGFIQMYFPFVTDKESLESIYANSTAEMATALDVAKEFIAQTTIRYNKIEEELHSKTMQSAAPCVMRELRALRYQLPTQTKQSPLELKFYELTPSRLIPFVRYFPANERSPPLVKLATTEGAAKISNPRLLDALMSEQPNTESGAILLVKLPITHNLTPLGVTWTARIFEDGSAELFIGAPRRDAPIPTPVIQEAFRILPEFLKALAYNPDGELKLLEITAVYEFKSAIEGGKPSKADFKKRLDLFLPMFSEERGLTGENAAILLRYKAVSNYVADSDPVMNYVTNLFLRDASQSLESIPTQTYISGIVREFGIPPSEAAERIQIWIRRHAEYVIAEGSKAMAAYNLGTAISVYNSHPRYMFLVASCESYTDLCRILTLLRLYTSKSATELMIAKTEKESEKAESILTAAAPPPPPELEAPEPEVKAEMNALFDQMMDFGMFAPAENAPPPNAENGPRENGIELVQETAPVPLPRQFEEVKMPELLGDDEVIPQVATEWYITRLRERDGELFGYKTADKRFIPYTRCCQANIFRHPNVLSAEMYNRARILYGDSVFWLEAPLNPEDVFAARFSAQTLEERKKHGKALKKTIAEMIALEKRALSLGLPLKIDKKGNQSIGLSDKTATAEDKKTIQELLVIQASKPLWIVVRAGSVLETSGIPRTNYYICAEMWCVRDDLPIIPNEFRGTVSRVGKTKANNTCPFCGGRMVTNRAAPAPGETVIQRDTVSAGEKIAKYAGYLSKNNHPDGYALPCCFTDPDNLTPPDGTKPLPPPVVALPDLQRAPEAADVPELPAAPEPAPAPEPAVEVMPENRRRPFAQKRGASQNKWYIPNQNILGRNSTDWFDLEKGAVAAPPASVNALFGQNPEKFLTKNKGVLGEKINSYLTAPATAFIRYGIGGSLREPGANLLSLIAFAQYATQHLVTNDTSHSIPTNEEVLRDIMESKSYMTAHAFEQANYGTLLHEFSRPSVEFPADRKEEFDAWCEKMGIMLVPGQRAAAENLFLAWDNFRNYVYNTSEFKELRHWEMLFTVPGLLTRTGFVIVRICLPKNKDEVPTIECPQFGLSFRDQAVQPPLLFVLEDTVTGIYDPLILYEGVSKDEKHLLGVVKPDSVLFGELSGPVREPIMAFTSQYFSPLEGCGRAVSPVHPWVPERDTTLMPRLGAFSTKVFDLDFRIESLLRDRSNRLVGVIVRHKPYVSSSLYYIPCLDDGTILPGTPSQRGEEVLPRPSLDGLLTLLVGAQKRVAEKRPGSDAMFPGLVPVRLITDGTQYVAIELRCGAVIPIEPTSSVKHPKFIEMKKAGAELKSDMPWETDIALLGPSLETDPTMKMTSEEVLDESFQHLRISFSNWLSTAAGDKVKKQIELLRRARQRLPLFELQKRLDILLTPFVAQGITMDGAPSSELLRRDCLQITKESECSGGCSWSDGRCLIHTTTTPRYLDPVRIMTARLADELLRTFGEAMEILQRRVSFLRPLPKDQLIKDKDSVIFAASGRGTESLYDKLGYSSRKSGVYTRGLTYPEEIDVESEMPGNIPTDWESVLHTAAFGADIARDNRLQLEAVLYALTEKSLDAIEGELHISFTGKVEDWTAIAQMLAMDVILTRYSPIKHVTEPFQYIKGTAAPGQRRFIVVDVFGIPLQNNNGSFVTSHSQLPPSLQMWLTSIA